MHLGATLNRVSVARKNVRTIGTGPSCFRAPVSRWGFVMHLAGLPGEEGGVMEAASTRYGTPAANMKERVLPYK